MGAGTTRFLEKCSSQLLGCLVYEKRRSDIEYASCTALSHSGESVCGSCLCNDNARGELGIRIELE